MAQEIRITGYHGINNLLARDRIKGLPTREDPLVELSAAQNFDLDDSGKPSVRPGCALFKSLTKPHSGFSHGGVCLYVRSGTLYRFYPKDKTSEPLVAVGDNKMRYWGHADRIWFTNEAMIGEVKEGAAQLFALPTNATEFKEMLPPGQVIAFFRGRLYTAVDNILCMSDDTHLGRMDTETGFKQFPETIRLLAPTLDGLYVGTERALYFGQGGTLHKMSFVRVSSFPVKDVPPRYIDASLVQGINAEGTFPLIETTQSILYGLPGGQIADLTGSRYALGTGISGSSFVREASGQFHYISVTR